MNPGGAQKIYVDLYLILAWLLSLPLAAVLVQPLAVQLGLTMFNMQFFFHHEVLFNMHFFKKTHVLSYQRMFCETLFHFQSSVYSVEFAVYLVEKIAPSAYTQ